MRTSIFSILLIFSTISYSQPPYLHYGGIIPAMAYTQSYLYMSTNQTIRLLNGYSSPYIDIDPGPGRVELGTSFPPYPSLFISSYNKDGKYLKYHSITSNNLLTPLGLCGSGDTIIYSIFEASDSVLLHPKKKKIPVQSKSIVIVKYDSVYNPMNYITFEKDSLLITHTQTLKDGGILISGTFIGKTELHFSNKSIELKVPSSSTNDDRIFILKLNRDFSYQNHFVFGNVINDIIYQISEFNHGGIAIAAGIQSINTSPVQIENYTFSSNQDYDIIPLLVLLNESFGVTNVIKPIEYGAITSVIIDSINNLYIAGQKGSSLGSAPYIAKYSEAGNLEWINQTNFDVKKQNQAYGLKLNDGILNCFLNAYEMNSADSIIAFYDPLNPAAHSNEMISLYMDSYTGNYINHSFIYQGIPMPTANSNDYLFKIQTQSLTNIGGSEQPYYLGSTLTINKEWGFSYYTSYCNPIKIESIDQSITRCNTLESTLNDKTIAIKVTGTGIRYQWEQSGKAMEDYYNIGLGVEIRGSKTEELTYDQLFNQGFTQWKFNCRLSNSCSPSVLSDTVYVTSYAAPTVKTNNSYIEANIDDSASFSVQLTNNYPADQVKYQWYKGEFALFENEKYIGSNTPQLSINKLNLFDDGYFQCIVSHKTCGSTILDVNIKLLDIFKDITKSNNALSLKIYPQPANDYIFIDDLSINSEVKIFNCYGAPVLNQLLSPGESINIIQLNPGIYVMMVNSQLAYFVKH